MKYSSEGDVCGVINLVVDDLCMAGDKSFDEAYTKLRERFKFGKRETGHGEFCGRKLIQDSGGIHVSQIDKISKITSIRLGGSRRGEGDESPCTPEEIRSMRNRIGQAHYISRETRRDMAAKVSIAAQTLPKPTIGDLRKLNQ